MWSPRSTFSPMLNVFVHDYVKKATISATFPEKNPWRYFLIVLSYRYFLILSTSFKWDPTIDWHGKKIPESSSFQPVKGYSIFFQPSKFALHKILGLFTNVFNQSIQTNITETSFWEDDIWIVYWNVLLLLIWHVSSLFTAIMFQSFYETQLPVWNFLFPLHHFPNPFQQRQASHWVYK